MFVHEYHEANEIYGGEIAREYLLYLNKYLNCLSYTAIALKIVNNVENNVLLMSCLLYLSIYKSTICAIYKDILIISFIIMCKLPVCTRKVYVVK